MACYLCSLDAKCDKTDHRSLSPMQPRRLPRDQLHEGSIFGKGHRDIRIQKRASWSFSNRVRKITPELMQSVTSMLQVKSREAARDCPIVVPLSISARSAVRILAKNAASEDRTHDLRIMRPTRCQLRYRRSCKL